jgi:hypothetical protein
VEISFNLTLKSAGEDEDDIYEDLYVVKWTSLMIPPIIISLTNVMAIAVGVSRMIYSTIPEWSRVMAWYGYPLQK